MGRNLLRRKILKIKFTVFFIIPVLAGILPAGVIPGGRVYADEISPGITPTGITAGETESAVSPESAKTRDKTGGTENIPPPAGDLPGDPETVFAGISLKENPEGEVLFSRPRRTVNSAAGNPAEINTVHPAPAGAEEPGPESLLSREALENPLTAFYIEQYSGPNGLRWLQAVMERGGPYLAFIGKEIAARKLPPELIYLPVIESGFLPTAVSKSGASGLWQFMENSVAPFGINVNEWIDERRDFWKSTEGALRKLEENYRYLGDWPLALAAYNAGLGAVNRIIRQSGEKNYFALSQKKLLKNETAHYVPKLVAVAHILSNRRRYGMEPLWPDDPEWKQIPVERPADIRLLAKEVGLDSGELIKANRELLYYVTPPGQKYNLKAAGKDAEKIAAVLGRDDIPLIRYYFHTVRSGDTLSALALHYGISVEQILASNPGTEARFLRIGGRLLIPALKEAAPYVRPVPAAGSYNFSGTHLVKKGETLWSIALAFEIDPETLAEANGMKLNDILREGRSLKTPIR